MKLSNQMFFKMKLSEAAQVSICLCHCNDAADEAQSRKQFNVLTARWRKKSLNPDGFPASGRRAFRKAFFLFQPSEVLSRQHNIGLGFFLFDFVVFLFFLQFLFFPSLQKEKSAWSRPGPAVLLSLAVNPDALLFQTYRAPAASPCGNSCVSIPLQPSCIYWRVFWRCRIAIARHCARSMCDQSWADTDLICVFMLCFLTKRCTWEGSFVHMLLMGKLHQRLPQIWDL